MDDQLEYTKTRLGMLQELTTYSVEMRRLTQEHSFRFGFIRGHYGIGVVQAKGSLLKNLALEIVPHLTDVDSDDLGSMEVELSYSCRYFENGERDIRYFPYWYYSKLCYEGSSNDLHPRYEELIGKVVNELLAIGPKKVMKLGRLLPPVASLKGDELKERGEGRAR